MSNTEQAESRRHYGLVGDVEALSQYLQERTERNDISLSFVIWSLGYLISVHQL
jgi:hypothetical protein